MTEPTSVAEALRAYFEQTTAADVTLAAVLAPLVTAESPVTDMWLAWAAIRCELPCEDDVVALRRGIALNGSFHALSALGARGDDTVFGPLASVEVLSDAVLVDVSHSSNTDSISGIQRVVRETVGRWASSHEVVLVAWTGDGRALRRLTPIEDSRIRGGERPDVDPAAPVPSMVIPAGGTFIVPELAAEPTRAERILALGRFSACSVGAIGYDIVPLTSGETATPDIATLFPLYLEALAYADRVATISAATAVEFSGWRRMLPASGKTGPDIRAVFLGGGSPSPATDDAAFARELGLQHDEPVVLVVGSHEPRKNHLSVLNAARLLWDQGLRFRLIFIGSGSWSNGGFTALADVLRGQGRHLDVRTGSSDDMLAAAYRLADISVFTSTHEGFGLPIVESLRSGTPVIASNIGSMREIAERYSGVMQIDPHDDRAIEQALRSVVSDPTIIAGLTADLANNRYRSWDDYAAELWSYFVE